MFSILNCLKQNNINAIILQVAASAPVSRDCYHPCLPVARCLDNNQHLSTQPHPSPPLSQLPIPHAYTHHQDLLGARQLKTYCYIPAHKHDGGGRGGDDEKSCESYC